MGDMTGLYGLSEEDIADWVGEDAMARGREYAAEGRVLLPEREGDLLRARVRGSLPTPYDVEAYVTDGGIEGAFCTCPVGGRGRCKHVAALLLTWVAGPRAFAGPEDLAADLQARSHEELVEIIQRMVARYPDLRTLIDLSAGTPDLDTVRRAAVEAFVRGAYDEWRAGETIAADLEPLAAVAARHAEAGDARAAAAVYGVLADEIVARYGEVADDYQSLAAMLGGSLEGLGGALAALTSPAARAPHIERLFRALVWAEMFPHPPLAEQARDVLLAEATPEERRRLSGWAWEALPAGASPIERAARRSLGLFMLDLEGDALPDDVYLSLCREAGLWPELVARLLARDRLDEALQVAAEAHPDDLLELADLLANAGYGAQAEAIVLERADEGDLRLIEWLKERARARSDPAAALAFAERLFARYRSVGRYREMRDLAEQVGRWEALRPRVIARLEEEGDWRPLMRIALDEGDIDAALGYSTRAPVPPLPENHDVRLEVARAAERDRPQEAIRLYMDYVRALIAGRTRTQYREAARVLRTVRRLYGRLGDQDAWHALIADLRATHRRLAALQDELSKARL
jgi:hypothetical protein